MNFFDEGDTDVAVNPETGRTRVTVRPAAKNFFDEEIPVADRVGTPEAIARGLGSGATFGFLPRIAGALAGGAAANPEYGGTMAPEEGYRFGQQVREEQAKRQKQAREQHPVAYGTGEFAGSVAVPLPGGSLMAAGRPAMARVGGGALQGIIGGGLSGAGEAETLGEMPAGAARGATMGGIVGAPVGALAPIVTHYGTSVARSFFRPEAQAERALAEAYSQAGRMPPRDPSGQPTRFIRGMPGVPDEAVVADYLGTAGQNLARTAKNTSPVAADLLQGVVQARAGGKTARQVEFLKRYGVNENELELQRIKAEAARENNPLYQLALWKGNTLPYSPHLEALKNAPAVQSAMGGVQQSIQNRVIGRGGASPGPVSPTSLQYWDQVKRGLDAQIGAAKRAGNNELVDELRPLKQRLLTTLDALVPEYAEARGSARKFFGQENAIEAGAHAVNNTDISAPAFRRSLGEMSPEDRRLTLSAARNEFAQQTANGTVKWADLLDPKKPKAFNERQKLEMIFGQDGFRELEAQHHTEVIMDWLRSAVMGNSTSAQQLWGQAALGAAGVFGGAGGGAFDLPTGGIPTSVGGALMLLHRGARIKGTERVAEQLGKMLSSNDPAMLERVYKAAVRSENFMQTLRNFSNAALARGAGAQAGRREEQQMQEVR